MTHSKISRRAFNRMVIAGSGGLALSTSLGGYACAQSGVLRWGSSSIGSSAYIIFEALVQTANKYSDIRNSSLATAGATENMALIDRGELEFGSTTSAGLVSAFKGEKPFQKPTQIDQMFATTSFDLPLLVRRDAGISSYEDLAGKRIMPSKPGSGANMLHSTIARAAGVYDEIDWTYGSWSETFDAFRTGAVDAVPAILNNGRQTPQTAELLNSVEATTVVVSDDLYSKVAELNPGIFNKSIAPDEWSLLETSTKVPSFPGLVVTSPDMSAETAYTVMKAIFDNAAEVHELAVQTKDIYPEFAAQFLVKGFPVNAGAAQYFKEKGLWREELSIAQ